MAKKVNQTAVARQDAKGDNPHKVPFDPERNRLKVPKGREQEFEAYMDAIANLDTSTHRNDLVPKDWRTNTVYNRDYDFVAAFLADKVQPVKMDDGYWHMGDVGKMPNHPTFSVESYYARDPKWAPYAGRWEGERFIPPAGSEVRQDAKGGDVGSAEDRSVPEAGRAPVPRGGPRIVINPKCFKDDRDCLCVAFNERFRIAMEQYGFEPQSEPTDRQRRFFADTAYADDEVQLRRTILARILTLDTSVKDPTDEQLQEAVAFLQEFKRRERPSNDWEASAIDRLEVLVQTVVNKGRRAVPKPQGGTVQADIGGGTTEDDEENNQQTQEPEETAEPEDTQEPIEEATPPETAEPEPPTEQPATEPAQPSTEPQVATTEPPSPENLEPGQIVTNNGTVTTEEEAQRAADDFKRSLLGDTDNSQDAAITEEPRKPEEASQPPQTQTAQQQAPAQTQQPAQQQTQTQAQAKPAAPSATVPQPVQIQPRPQLTKAQRRMRRYLRALYGKEYAYSTVYGGGAMPKAKATPRRRT